MNPGLSGVVPSTGAVLATSTVQTVGAVVAVLAMIGFGIYVLVSIRSGREEVGSEVELAPNRKPYYDDDKLESTKLTRTLGLGLALLAVSSVGLPIYWLAEPGRQEGAVESSEAIFVSRGAEQYETGSQCVNCHAAEGRGGQAAYTILDANGDFVASVNWLAPALDTVLLRFTEEEVHEIIEFGRPGTPMPAWGAGGGGPRSEQEIDNIVDYLGSLQLPYEDAQRNAAVQLAIELGYLDEGQRDDPDAADAAIARIDYDDLQTGETLFTLGKDPVFEGGAYACARCHDRGWSIITEGEDAVQPVGADISDYVDYGDGSGGYGPTLDDLVPRKFATIDELAEFINTGSEAGIGYGTQGQGSGRMPSYGDNPNTETVAADGMLTPEMVCAVARYAATLRGGEEPTGEVPTTTTSSTTTTTAPESEDAEAESEEDDSGDAQAGFCEAAAEDEQE